MPGVYEIADANRRTIYIGQSSRDVPNRLRQHLQGGGCVAERGEFWRYAYSRIPEAHEADHLERHRAMHGGELPHCNRATQRLRSSARRLAERMRGDD